MKKIHLIGNAHLDPVWLWQWQEGFAEVKATFRSALDRMKEFSDFKFTSACSAYYMWIEKSDPGMFSEITQRVKEGRWNIVGGWFIQPDCNIPSGESYARHALISQRYFQEKFGVTANTGYNVDSFGHNGNLPQILKKSGIDHYVFMRPMPHEKQLPGYLFDWERMDRSRVRTYRIPEFYNIDQTRFEVFQKVKDLAKHHDMMAFYGVGNHGGGATVELLDQMHRTLDQSFIYSTVNEYFDAVKEDEVPVVHDDLQYHAKGCYSAMSEVKANNRLCENKLFEAEEYSVLSKALMNTPYPADEYKKAWEDVLFNQFHDIMGGCAIKEAYIDARYLHGEAAAVAERNANFALQQISWNIDTMDGRELNLYKEWLPAVAWCSEENIGTPIVIFNPLSYDVETIVSVHNAAKIVTDAEKNKVPIQYVRDSKTIGAMNYKMAFYAKVPALGYTVYRMYFKTQEENYETTLSVSDERLENRFLRVDFDGATGEISSIYDKTTKRQLMGCSSAVLMDESDSDTWAHGIYSFRKCAAVCESGSVKLIEKGPVRAAVRCEQTFEQTHIIRDYYLGELDKKLTVKTKIDFREKHRMLKFSFDVKGDSLKAFNEIPYSYIERKTDGGEQPTGAWIAMTDQNSGIGIATTSKYSFDADHNILSLTILRGSIYAEHENGELASYRDEFCEYMDQGEHEFTYTIFPFVSFADAEKQAQRLNNKPTAIVETFHHGKLGTRYSGISISENNIIVTALKKHEDSDAFVLRCYEAENKRTTAEIRLFGAKFTACFGANEIKTFVINEKNEVKETSFLE